MLTDKKKIITSSSTVVLTNVSVIIEASTNHNLYEHFGFGEII